MRSDRLSILLAVHNGAQWLDEAIKSVVDQSWQNWELIVVDNGSTDGSFAIAERHTLEDPRVKAVRLEEKGKNLAYNHAFTQSTGTYVSFFAADDILPPESIEKRMKLVLGRGARVFATCALRTISDEPKYDGIVIPRDATKPNFSGGVLLFSRDLAEQLFPIPTELPNEDTWTQLHLRAFGMHHHYPEPLYQYRIHGNNSFGYHVPFAQKREGFLRRMRAYELFLAKYQGSAFANDFINRHVGQFVKGVQALRANKIAPLLVSSKLPMKMKLLFAYYSSPLLYRLRMSLFRFTSGRLIQM